jgi:hypothetical protein
MRTEAPRVVATQSSKRSALMRKVIGVVAAPVLALIVAVLVTSLVLRSVTSGQ